ncbi:TetR family transcriptional regulator [Pseudonocardia xinjiangensis]|uniref:TetR family transcriptional regulator n=1 Tax=Pseudonocardia xinjiangensis TaxID=75289 RepID=A0ABX1RMQ0_9PSEU|nr:TetR family transcriptional regulator [Pseudonocardia xinjiangensis]NMH80543.1 TetR family transcriptional regulator [Pseudonocardia xinjiangensis]
MTGATRRGRSAQGRAEVRRDLVAAAVTLFRERGYEDTTVDDIAAAAGVGRRTFFRYFRSKEDAVSPDHETALARAAEVFETAHATEPAAALALRAGETVFDIYTDDPHLSVERYRLTHDVPVLRDRESASIDHYRRLFTRYLRGRFADDPDGDLRAAVIGAAVVAAHNLALRAWLAAGAPEDGMEACRLRFRRVAEMLPGEPAHTNGLHAVTRRLEQAVVRLERTTPPAQ